MYVAVAVGDKALDAIEDPGAILFFGSFEHYCLKVAACIWFGKVHRHGFAGANAGDEALFLVFAAKFI